MANLRKKSLRAASLLMAVCMCLTMQSVSFADETGESETAAGSVAENLASQVESAEQESESSINASIMATGDRNNIYSAYLERHSGADKPLDKEIVINAVDYVSTEDNESGIAPRVEKTEYEGVSDVLYWKNHEGKINYKFNVEKTGLYHLEMLYYPVSGDNTTVEVAMLIDGDYPFTAAKTFTLDRYWTDATPIRKDSKDNDIRPTQAEYDCWVTYPIKDKEGLFNEPYYFYLEAGEHTLTFDGIKVNTVFKSFTFKNYEDSPEYVKPSDAEIASTPALTTTNDIGSNTIFVQGEQSVYKTASTLYATYDRTSCMTNPSHPTKQRYNTVGQATWNKATQAITWEFSVPNDGYYKFNFKVRQNQMRGFFSNRRIYIDGAVPNQDCEDVKFPYDANWYCQTLTDSNGDDMYIYLTAGKHSLTMEAIPGSIGAVMQRLDDLVYTLNYYYRRILMITGPDPDEYNDYFVDKQIPELLDVFKTIIDQLYAEKAGIEELTGGGSEASSLQTMAVYLQMMVDKPDDIPTMKDTLKDSISTVSAWMRDYRDQPLEIDYIEIGTVNEKFSAAQGNFVEEFVFSFNSFIGSFFEDYTMLSDSSTTALNVWVSLGRDQATVVKELVDSDFNATHDGVEASINLVQGGILEATLAGKGPEIALFIGGDFPIQLAARDLLVDLTRFSDYNDIVAERFTPNIETLYTYNGGVYGLPVSQTFPMMFYRTDILEELGIEEVPETWDEFTDLIPVLQRTYLQAGLLSPASNLSSSVFESGDTFAMLVLQTGNNIYNDDLTKTTYDQQSVIRAFERWTKFYTVFDFEQTYDAFSRFRTGEMPIVIQNYTFYNQLSVSAPEIKGLWNFTLVPGTVQEDGTISHAANSSSSGAIIFNKVSDTQAAWEFIKWFTSTEVQVDYGRTIEALMGPMGRFDTANVQALEQLPWSTSEYNKISAQMSETVEIPIIPASYATTRHTKNAFRAVVNDAWNPRYALSSYNRDINSEITRKNNDIALYKAS